MALFERLKAEVGRGGRLEAALGSDRRALRSRYRSLAERFWPVTAERPTERRPGVKGTLAFPVKRALRPLLRWYVEPVAHDQRNFNDAALKLVDELFEEVDRLFGRAAELAGRTDGLGDDIGRVEGKLSERIDRELSGRRDDSRLLGELEERLTRAERREGGTPRTVAPQATATAFPDYFAFESRMRGQFAEIKERQRLYVGDFREAAPVLDVGCGRGELLALLRDEGIEARGVDADGDMVAYARGEGLEVEQADGVSYLEALEDGSLGGIFLGQVVEHLPPPALVRLLELSAGKLRAGGVLVAETINPLSPTALRNYHADLTHAQPLVPETFVLLARQAGFAAIETRFLNEPPAEERLRPVELPRGAEFDAARSALAANVDRLNEQLFGPLDYAIVART